MPARQPRDRIWCIPPVLVDEPGELLEGMAILQELPGPDGLVLWQTFRDVALWTGVPASERADLFTAGADMERNHSIRSAGLDQDLAISLTSLATLLAAPADSDASILRILCLRVVRWATRRRALATAIAFAQVAAQMEPDDPDTALLTGRLALRAGSATRAETWLRRAIAVARRREQWVPWTQAYLELGILYRGRGDAPRARRAYLRAMRMGRRKAIWRSRAAAYQGLMHLAADAGDIDAAGAFAGHAAALSAFHSVPATEVACDLARIWVRNGLSEDAVALLQRILDTDPAPAERTRVLALLALAAAGAGHTDVYEKAGDEAWIRVTREDAPDWRSRDAFLDLGQAAALAGDWRRIREAQRIGPPDIRIMAPE